MEGNFGEENQNQKRGGGEEYQVEVNFIQSCLQGVVRGLCGLEEGVHKAGVLDHHLLRPEVGDVAEELGDDVIKNKSTLADNIQQALYLCSQKLRKYHFFLHFFFLSEI